MTVTEVKMSEILALLYFRDVENNIIKVWSWVSATVFYIDVCFKINLNILDWRLNKQMRCMELWLRETRWMHLEFQQCWQLPIIWVNDYRKHHVLKTKSFFNKSGSRMLYIFSIRWLIFYFCLTPPSSFSPLTWPK